MMNESVRSGSLRVGLLPLYFKLYDELIPDRRIGAEAYHALLASLIEAAGVTPVNVPVCRVKEEVDDAISLFETENVDCVVVLNLSYSPSMEAVYSHQDGVAGASAAYDAGFIRIFFRRVRDRL